MRYINLCLISNIFEKLSSPKIAGYFDKLQEKVNGLKQSEWEEYYRIYFSVLDTIVSSLQSEDILSNSCYQKIASLKLNAESILKGKFSVEVETPIGQDHSFLKAMNYLGIISWYESEGKITFFKSPTLVLPLFRYISDMDENSLKKHIKSIQKIKQPEKTDEQLDKIVDEGIDYVNDFVSKFRNIWLEHIKEILNLKVSTAQLDKVASIELLPTSADFYFAGIEYYKHKFLKEVPTHFTFATTSGIILPEEHHGARYFTDILSVQELAQRADKNPIRENYFEIVREAQMNKPRAYYFEMKRTSDTLKKTYNELKNIDSNMAEKYIEDAIQILKEYLQLPTFSLIKVSEFPDEFNYLTLGNTESVLLSLRDESQKIAHGLWIKPKGSLLRQAFSDIKPKDLILPLVGTGVGSLITGGLLQNLVVAFAAAFAPLIFFGVQKVRGVKQAKDAVFDIGNRIKKKRMEIEIIKDFNKSPYIEPEKFIQQLLA
jgi:hypothetical protein